MKKKRPTAFRFFIESLKFKTDRYGSFLAYSGVLAVIMFLSYLYFVYFIL